jgi:hypothetical protein
MKRLVSTAAFVSAVNQKKPAPSSSLSQDHHLLPVLECRQSLLAIDSTIQGRLPSHHRLTVNPMHHTGVRLRATPVLPDHHQDASSLDVDGFVRQPDASTSTSTTGSPARPSHYNNKNNSHSTIESKEIHSVTTRDKEVTMAIFLLNAVAVIWGTQVSLFWCLGMRVRRQ